MKSEIPETRYTILFMKLNNQKNWQIRGKITKTVVTFHKNKPNLKNIKIGVSSFETGKYGILSAWWNKKQTQYKPNTNPIPERPKMNANIYYTKVYNNLSRWRGKKTKPIQTQFKPNPQRICLGQNLQDLGNTNAISNINQNHYISFYYRTALEYFINKTWANTRFSLNKYYNTFRLLLLIIRFGCNLSGERHV